MLRSNLALAASLGGLCVAALTATGTSSARPPEFGIKQIAELRDGNESILARPWEIAQRADGSFLVVDFSDRNIKVYEQDGRREGTIGSAGRGPGQFGTVLSVFPVESGIGAYDFLDSQLVLFDSLGSEVSRSSLVADRRARQPTAVRYLGPDQLLAVYQSGGDGAGFLEVIDFGGSVKVTFMSLDEWYQSHPATAGAERILADALDGCIFAASTFSDSLRVFDYAGRQLAAGVWDPSARWPNVIDPQAVSPDRPHVQSVVALPGCRALVQVRTGDERLGEEAQEEDNGRLPIRWHPLEGGELALFRPALPGHLHRETTTRLTNAGLLGRDQEGHGLLLRNPRDAHDPFVLLRIVVTGS